MAGPTGGASDARSLVGVASASGIRATYTVPDYVVVAEFFDEASSEGSPCGTT